MVNATNLKSGGALQVAGSLLREWTKKNQGHEFHFVCGPALHHLTGAANHIHCYYYHAHPSYLSPGIFRFRKYMDFLEQSIQADVVLTIFGPSLWRPKAAHLCGFANGIFLFRNDPYILDSYPLNSFRGWKYRVYRKILLYTLQRNADAFWVETAAAKQELQKIGAYRTKPIDVVGNTYPDVLHYHQKTEGAVPQLLLLSAYYPHKNFELLPELIRLLSEKKVNVCFLVTLPSPVFNKLKQSVPQTAYLKNLGPVTPEQLQSVYDLADIVFMPSLLETFSSNFPEAMRCGKPIICSERPFAIDVCGDAALYFNPLSAHEASERIEQLVNDRNLQEVLRNKGFKRLEQMETPETRATKILELLLQLRKKNQE